jgi:hypothetical protein
MAGFEKSADVAVVTAGPGIHLVFRGAGDSLHWFALSLCVQASYFISSPVTEILIKST